MKNTVNILFIDDNEDFARETAMKLELSIDSIGFTINPHIFPNGRLIEENNNAIFSVLNDHDIELIIIDYSLPGIKGDEVIKRLRNKHKFHDIIFYSQTQIPNTVFKTHTDGVYIATRANIDEILYEIISLKLKKYNDLAMFRGCTVADSIEIEFLLEELLKKCFKERGDFFHKKFLLGKTYFDFYKKWKILQSIMLDKIDECKNNVNLNSYRENLQNRNLILKQLYKQIICVRNTVAHQKEEFDETISCKVLKAISNDAEDIPHTNEKCAEIRKNLDIHHKNLLAIAQLIDHQNWELY